MNNNQTEPMQYAEPSSEMVAKPGTLLRQKRESLQLTQQQVADKLRLRVTLIQSIEDNNFNIDKVKTFTRGYVRSYARMVGIEESIILASYDAHYGTTPQDVAMKSFSKRTKREQHNSRINYLTFGIVLIVIGISSVWWYQNQSKDTLMQESVLSASSDAVTELENSEANFVTVTDLTAEQADTSTSVDSDNIDADEVETMATSSAPAQTASDSLLSEEEKVGYEWIEGPMLPETVVNSESSTSQEPLVTQDVIESSPLISMNFNADCWIQVKDANGKTLSVGLKKAGQSLSLDGIEPFSVILGAPENVSVTFASEPVDLSRYTSGKVARFTLSR